MAEPTTRQPPRCRRPIFLFDGALRVAWSNIPGFRHTAKRPWEFAPDGDVERLKTALSVCKAVGEPQSLAACLDIEGPGCRYQLQLSNTGCEQLPVIALCQWADERIDLVTARECEILALTTLGLPAKAIGRRLGISASTVDTHRNRIRAKLKLRTIADLAIWATENLPSAG